jgi:tubulin polyglutamylase TTLL11
MEEHPKFTFICKPNSGKGGEGIFLADKFKDIPKNLWKDSHSDLLVQRYIKTPILLDKKKFDLRVYVLIKGFDPVEAYLCDEGLARFCTEDYRQPNPQNMKNMFMHLTNFTLNK